MSYEAKIQAEEKYQEALKHFKMAADAGYVEGQGLYGYYMLSLEHNIDTGIEYLEKAADQGDLNATEYLCRVYYGGEFGIKPDLNKAYTYSQKLPSNNNMTDMLRRKHAIQRYLFDD